MRDKLNKRLLDSKCRKSLTPEKIRYLNKYQIDKELYLTHKYRFLPDLSCAICIENRVFEICHIIPISKGGSNDLFNLICLCPNHHTLYDTGKLYKREYNKIRSRIKLAKKYLKLNTHLESNLSKSTKNVFT